MTPEALTLDALAGVDAGASPFSHASPTGFAARLRDTTLPRFLAAEDDDATTTAPEEGPLARVLRDRASTQDAAVERLRAGLRSTAERLADALTAYVEGRAGGTESARVRAAIYQTRLDDLLVLLEEIGLADAEQEWYRRLARLPALAEQTLDATGVRDADRALDSEAAQANIRAYLGADRDDFWDGAVVRPSAERMLRGLRTSIEVQPIDEVIRIVARDEGVTLPQAASSAITRAAEYDRFVNAEAARQADPTGDVLLWAYTGPDDGIERPFCDRLNGLFFTREQVGRLDNSQPGTGHPVVSGGGWRCRHQWVHGTAATLAAIGYQRGGDLDVEAANAAAAGARR